MSFMAALLLVFLNKVETFSIMKELIHSEKFHLTRNFMNTMIGMKQSYYTFMCLTKKFLPKLHNHFVEENFEPSMYITPWFMTLFSSNVPI